MGVPSMFFPVPGGTTGVIISLDMDTVVEREEREDRLGATQIMGGFRNESLRDGGVEWMDGRDDTGERRKE
jgi:hypothetical protein